MRILALDAAAAAISAALLEDGRILAHRFEAMERGHAERLLPMVVAVMTGVPWPCLDAVAVSVGPGSFTGIRVGLAAARGIGLALGIPVVGVTTFEAVARAAAPAPAPGRRLLAVVESKRREIYVQLLDQRQRPLAEPKALTPEDIARYVGPGPIDVAGDGAARVAAALASAGLDASLASVPATPDAARVAEAAFERLRAEGPPAHPARPLYLRPPDVTVPGQGSTTTAPTTGPTTGPPTGPTKVPSGRR